MANKYARRYYAQYYRRHPYRVLGWVVLLVALFFLCCLEVRRYRYSSALASCIKCYSCDCSKETTVLPIHIEGSFADCGKDDPETYEEMKKNMVDLQNEEMELRKSVTADSLERTKIATKDQEIMFDHYHTDWGKCNVGMETCEKARERAQAELIKERKKTDMWIGRFYELNTKKNTASDSRLKKNTTNSLKM